MNHDRYIIDGYNLLFRSKRGSKKTISQDRLELLIWLNEALLQKRSRATIIFDGHVTDTHNFPSRASMEQLEIIFSPHGMDGDSYILEYLSTLKRADLYTLVTSDAELTRKARVLSVKSLSIKEFINELPLHKKNEESKPSREYAKEIERLERLFKE